MNEPKNAGDGWWYMGGHYWHSSDPEKLYTGEEYRKERFNEESGVGK